MTLEVEHLVKQFGTTTVLDDISLSVGRGEILAVVGPSGAGKSTLARSISFLERPTSGVIRADGEDFTRLTGDALITARRRIGTIFQTAPLLRRRTVAENVALPLEYLGATTAAQNERVTDLLKRVGLWDKRDFYPSQLSGGQKQRVGIARALALGPSNLLSDEATSGLDPETTTAILELLRELRDAFGLSILLITHEMDVVREIADSVARIDDGRIVEQGRVGDILLDPASALAHDLLPDRPTIHAPAGSELWEVSYASRDVALDWITALGADFPDHKIDVLSASVEAIHGVGVGRAVLALSPAAPRNFAEYLNGRGLHLHETRRSRRAEVIGGQAQPAAEIAELPSSAQAVVDERVEQVA